MRAVGLDPGANRQRGARRKSSTCKLAAETERRSRAQQQQRKAYLTKLRVAAVGHCRGGGHAALPPRSGRPWTTGGFGRRGRTVRGRTVRGQGTVAREKY